jgi:hypothetical protein
VIRRLNYTGRKSIRRSQVTVRLRQIEAGYDFAVEFDPGAFRFPPEARIYVEAYNAASYMRFDFGTVGEFKTPRDTRLTEVMRRPLPRFRLKVVDVSQSVGLLLGVADQIVPLRPDEDVAQRQSLLPVDFVDLGERAWRLDLLDWPVLELNRNIGTIAEAARSSGAFVGLVYPEVVRAVLTEAIIGQDITDPNFDDSSWASLWLRYACSLPGMEAPPQGASEEARANQADWIDSAVQAFCRHWQARERLDNTLGKELG